MVMWWGWSCLILGCDKLGPQLVSLTLTLSKAQLPTTQLDHISHSPQASWITLPTHNSTAWPHFLSHHNIHIMVTLSAHNNRAGSHFPLTTAQLSHTSHSPQHCLATVPSHHNTAGSQFPLTTKQLEHTSQLPQTQCCYILCSEWMFSYSGGKWPHDTIMNN